MDKLLQKWAEKTYPETMTIEQIRDDFVSSAKLSLLAIGILVGFIILGLFLSTKEDTSAHQHHYKMWVMTDKPDWIELPRIYETEEACLIQTHERTLFTELLDDVEVRSVMCTTANLG